MLVAAADVWSIVGSYLRLQHGSEVTAYDSELRPRLWLPVAVLLLVLEELMLLSIHVAHVFHGLCLGVRSWRLQVRPGLWLGRPATAVGGVPKLTSRLSKLSLILSDLFNSSDPCFVVSCGVSSTSMTKAAARSTLGQVVAGEDSWRPTAREKVRTRNI